jgi:hypothetical protein
MNQAIDRDRIEDGPSGPTDGPEPRGVFLVGNHRAALEGRAAAPADDRNRVGGVAGGGHNG